MIVDYCPRRNRIARELERCTSMQDLVRLLRICGNCIHRIFEEAQGTSPAPGTYRRDAIAMLISEIRLQPDNENYFQRLPEARSRYAKGSERTSNHG